MENMIKARFFVLLLAGVFSCQSEELQINIQDIALNAGFSGESNISATSDGEVYLTFIEYLNDTLDVLKFSKLEDGKWTEPRVISKGSDWFVNWADFPSMVQFETNPDLLVAHWLQKRTMATYDYDIMVSFSKDGGKTWRTPIVLHQDGVNAEHGFVSLIPDGNFIRAIWLDGRNTIKKELADHQHGSGSMALYTALIDENGKSFQEISLDERVCDCCQTDAVSTKNGIVAVYRDRSEDEIRDIGIVHIDEYGRFSKNMVHEDGWKISGCPVNGPSIDASGSNVLVAWYTEADSIPKTYLAHSEDFGESFESRIEIPSEYTLGRTDVKFINESLALVTYLDKYDGNTWIMGGWYDTHKKELVKQQPMVRTNASRGSGFPRIVQNDGGLVMTYTHIEEDASQVKTVAITLL